MTDINNSTTETINTETKVENVHGFGIAVINCESVVAGTKILDTEVTIPTFKIGGDRDEFVNKLVKLIEEYTINL